MMQDNNEIVFDIIYELYFSFLGEFCGKLILFDKTFVKTNVPPN